jgi:hypothetical protein
MPFDSAEAFRHFAASVKHDRRYIYSTEVSLFLDAVEETAQTRVKTIPKSADARCDLPDLSFRVSPRIVLVRG